MAETELGKRKPLVLSASTRLVNGSMGLELMGTLASGYQEAGSMYFSHSKTPDKKLLLD